MQDSAGEMKFDSTRTVSRKKERKSIATLLHDIESVTQSVFQFESLSHISFSVRATTSTEHVPIVHHSSFTWRNSK